MQKHSVLLVQFEFGAKGFASTKAPADFAWADFLCAAVAPHEGCSGRYGGRDVML